MLRLTTLAAAIAVVVPPVVAQDMQMPKPASELKPFEQLVGTWEGKGTHRQAPGGEAQSWTATVEVKPILGGFFFQEDIAVDMGADAPYAMRTIYGWNAEEKQYCLFATGNDGHAFVGQPTWVGDDTLVVAMAATKDGKRAVGRSVWKVDGDKLEFRNSHAIDDGKWYEAIEGQFERTETGSPAAVEASFMQSPVATETEKLKAFVGEWRVDGFMLEPHSNQKIPIGAIERAEMILGGHVLHSHVIGDDSPMGKWEGHSYVVWDAQNGRYDSVMFSNMGEFGHAHGWWADDSHMVAISACKAYGSPTVNRGVIELSDGKPKSYYMDSISGLGDAVRSFQIAYQPAKD